MKELLEGVAVRLLAERNRLPEIDALEENLRSIRVSVCKQFDEVARTSTAASPAAMATPQGRRRRRHRHGLALTHCHT
jgi:DNA-binding GntR family transcriptional regulator